LEPDGVDYHRVGGPDEGPPRLFFPELKIFCCNEFVADYAPGHRPEASRITSIDYLFRRGGVEVGHRLRTQDEYPVALRRDGKSPPNLAVYLDCTVGTGLETLAAADTGLILYLEQERLIPRHRNSIGGAYTYTSQA
jgi:hypothetical protein